MGVSNYKKKSKRTLCPMASPLEASSPVFHACSAIMRTLRPVVIQMYRPVAPVMMQAIPKHDELQ